MPKPYQLNLSEGRAGVVGGPEARPAAAAGDGVRVVHREARTHQGVHVVDLGALQEVDALRVHVDLDAVRLDHPVVRRRGVLEQLGRGDASIGALAGRFGMTLTGMSKHVGVLERAGPEAGIKVQRMGFAPTTCDMGIKAFTPSTFASRPPLL